MLRQGPQHGLQVEQKCMGVSAIRSPAQRDWEECLRSVYCRGRAVLECATFGMANFGVTASCQILPLWPLRTVMAQFFLWVYCDLKFFLLKWLRGSGGGG